MSDEFIMRLLKEYPDGLSASEIANKIWAYNSSMVSFDAFYKRVWRRLKRLEQQKQIWRGPYLSRIGWIWYFIRESDDAPKS
jgi:predicted DNA-binding protein (MmcQ/YjbR family)